MPFITKFNFLFLKMMNNFIDNMSLLALDYSVEVCWDPVPVDLFVS